MEAQEELDGQFAHKMKHNKIKNKIIVLALIAMTLFLTGCPDRNDEIYPFSEEQYLMGWILHNVNDSTPTELSYSYNDLAIYNFSFNYPANNSNVYLKEQFWVSPYQNFAGTSGVNLPLPQNRVYYVKGDKIPESLPNPSNRQWSFYNSVRLNYLSSEDPTLQFLQFVSSAEYYKSEDAFFAAIPVPGQKEKVYFGTSPYTPASILFNSSYLFLNDNLLRGFDGQTYLKINTQIWTLYLPSPTYKIFLNNNLIKEGNLTLYNRWDKNALFEYLSESGDYVSEIEIPSLYPVFSKVLIKTSFHKDLAEDSLNLPILKHIEFPVKFSVNKDMPVSVEFENPKDISSVALYIKTENMPDWMLVSNSANGNFSVSDDTIEGTMKWFAQGTTQMFWGTLKYKDEEK